MKVSVIVTKTVDIEPFFVPSSVFGVDGEEGFKLDELTRDQLIVLADLWVEELFKKAGRQRPARIHDPK